MLTKEQQKVVRKRGAQKGISKRRVSELIRDGVKLDERALTEEQSSMLSQALVDHNPMFWKFAKNVSEVTKEELKDVYQELCLYATAYTIRNYKPDNNKEVPLSSYLWRGLYKAAVTLKSEHWTKKRLVLKCKSCFYKDVGNACSVCTRKSAMFYLSEVKFCHDSESLALLIEDISNEKFGRVHERSTVTLQDRKNIVSLRLSDRTVAEIAKRFDMSTPRMSFVINDIFKNLQGAFNEA